MNSDLSLPFSAALQSSLHCLRQAFDCAARLHQPAWEFAVETDFLRSAFGLSQTEIRWLDFSLGLLLFGPALQRGDEDALARQIHASRSTSADGLL